MKRIQPPQAERGQGRLSPTKTDSPSPDSLFPVFSLRFVGGDYCLSHCEKDDKASFADRIHKLSKMSWSEIKQAPRHGWGIEPIDQLNNRLPHQAPEGARALALRFSGKKPMVGYRDGNIFYIVWFDRNFTLYNHG